MKRTLSQDERRAELERSITDDRRTLRAAIADVGTAARRDVSPTELISEHPWEAIGAAALLGLFFGYRRSISHVVLVPRR